MTTATTIDTAITPPPEVRPTKMKSHRYDVEVYAQALEFSKEDGGLQHVMNTLVKRYVDNKIAQHATAKTAPKGKPSKAKAAAEPEVAAPEYDPFA